MIKTEFYATLEDGTVLVRTYSDAGMYIIQDGTGIEYSEAVDPEKMNRTYTESERKIPEDQLPEIMKKDSAEETPTEETPVEEALIKEPTPEEQL